MAEEKIILVNEQDEPMGIMDKTEVHQKGLLHRAFSVFVFNSTGQLILQKRAKSKYHSGGLWTNTCCSHPLAGEEMNESVKRRLFEEMGLKCDVIFQFKFIYKSEVGNGLTEHEFDHVFFGITDQKPEPNPAEASLWKYIDMDELESELNEFPERFTIWLQICFTRVKEEWNNQFGN